MSDRLLSVQKAIYVSEPAYRQYMQTNNIAFRAYAAVQYDRELNSVEQQLHDMKVSSAVQPSFKPIDTTFL